MTDNALTTTQPASRTWLRRLGLLMAVTVLLALLGSLAFHLQGRSRYQDAAARFVSELGAEVSDLSPDAFFNQIAGLAPATPPEARNAARWLIAGAQAIVWEADEIDHAKALSRVPLPQWTAEQRLVARELVERNRGGLETLHRAAPLAGSDYGVAYDDLKQAKIPNLIELMNAGHLVSLEARLAFDSGEVEAGFAALETLARLTDSLRGETVLIFALIGHVTEKLQLQGISEVLTRPESWAASPEILGRLAELMPKSDMLAATKNILAIDAAVLALSAIEGHLDLWIEIEPSRLRAYYFGTRQATHFLDLGRRTTALVYQPYALAKERFESPTREQFGLGTGYRQAITKGQAVMSQRRLVAAALELRRLGLEDAAYPETCDDLEAQALPDPFAGRPLICQRRKDGSFHLEIPDGRELAAEISKRPVLWLSELTLPALEVVAGL